MASSLVLARAQPELTIGSSVVRAVHAAAQFGDIDTVICTGRKTWQVPLKCTMGGDGMFVDSWFLNLNKCIGFVQSYEHSRGGHTDPTLTLLNFDGSIHGVVDRERAASRFDVAVYDEHKLWFLHRDDREFRAAGLPNFTGTCLMQIDLATGLFEKEIPIQVPPEFTASQHLSHAWLTTIGLSALEVKFAEAGRQVVLDISVVNYQRDKNQAYESLQIPLLDILDEEE